MQLDSSITILVSRLVLLQILRFLCHILHSKCIPFKDAYRNELNANSNNSQCWGKMIRIELNATKTSLGNTSGECKSFNYINGVQAIMEKKYTSET